MGLTKVSTDGVKDDAITKAKIPANQIETSELAPLSVTNLEIADGSVVQSKIGDQQVTLDKLPHGDSNNDGKFLRANNGADPSFETVTSTNIIGNADNRVITGSGTANTLNGESALTFDGSTLGLTGSQTISGDLTIADSIIHSGDTNTKIRFPAADNISMEVAGSEVFKIVPDAGHGSTQSLRMMSSHTVDGARVNMSGTKAYSAGIIRGMVNVRDGNAYNVTDNGGGIGFSAIYNTGGSHTTMSQIEGVKANNTDGNYEGAIKLSTRHNLGNMIEKARIGQEGLSFNGDTAAANCLSDYEEGTFTPDWRGGQALGTTSYGTTNSASYTKIGRMVTVTGRTDITGSVGGQGFWFCRNMPFNVNSGGKGFNAVGSVSLENTNFANDTTYVIATMEQNNNNMHIHTVRDNAGIGTGVSPSNGAMTVQWTITYQTT